MAYIDKKSLLTAYKVLSHNTSSPFSQGATQFISAIRYLFALDRFVLKNNKNCDTKEKEDRELFIKYVGDIVSIDGSCYTSNFFTDIKDEKDYKVGSNFFSVNVVKESIANPVVIHDFPRRTKDAALFNVQNGVLSINRILYKNIKKYLKDKDCRIALAIWLCRKYNFSVSEIGLPEIKRYLAKYYSTELLNELFSTDSDFTEYIITYGNLKMSREEAMISPKEIYKMFDKEDNNGTNSQYYKYIDIITAIKTKPFLLLAGISGTGKSRIVRELARACWDEDSIEYKAQKPKNFEIIQVKPNWHDSTELIGYVSRVSGTPVYVIGDFLRFITQAWENLDIPYFLCLDEMNLAPVEQYFAEFLSVIESRKSNEDGTITTDPILKKSTEDWYRVLTAELTGGNETLRNRFLEEGITIPQNLIVMGTVNMDETTFSFSRKVLDRAMTIEMNEVDLYAGLDSKYEHIGKLNSDMLIGTAVEGVDVYADNEEVCNKVLSYLQAVNDVLNGTPFKIAYRTRNEFLLYVVNNLPYNLDEKGNEFSEDEVIAIALDEITSMKILSRIEGDDTKIKHSLLESLIATIEAQLLILTGEEKKIESISVAKLKEMKERLTLSGYTSFWS
ncbi:ATPase associated with various cellular activities AAA_5 [Phocaeicola salanitronis DSM 18170]|uniref:ATPase associated with various cellular activities AAA_5 n=1 Tax=Phocaeicola salanitronis (strain DSM 18170 / JCM 13657 / CCUG 60908 / BL78) TaxID=667015 RepID=F0QZP6_PHOSB|nr:AAA family ATPase [Phocaeicola salanitronis]ADY36147.1 ATPase associated with various cellular activities AAA_5 [Phocaeicola salanitronis DSM 18170]